MRFSLVLPEIHDVVRAERYRASYRNRKELILNTLSIIIAAATLVIGAAGLFVAWLQYRRIPKPPEPAYEPSEVIFGVARMKEPPGRPGYGGRRRHLDFSGRDD